MSLSTLLLLFARTCFTSIVSVARIFTTLEVQQAVILSGHQQERQLEYRVVLEKIYSGRMRLAPQAMQLRREVILLEPNVWLCCLTNCPVAGTIAHVEALLQCKNK